MNDAERKALAEAVPYIKQARDAAECRHDTPGEYYMDGAQYEMMQDADQLIKDIETILKGD